MKTTERFHCLALSLLVFSAIAGGFIGCDEEKATQESIGQEVSIDDSGSISEMHGTATMSMLVMPEGKVAVVVKDNDGRVKKDITGEVIARPLRAEGEPEPVTAKLEQNDSTGLLRAGIPALEEDLTELTYKLIVDGKPMQGTLHLPKGGTPELVNNAKAAAEVKDVTADVKGPHGGIVQVVGEDKVEVVANKEAEEVRVYILDNDLKPVVVGERKVKLAIATEQGPKVIELAPHEDKTYFTGTLHAAANPTKVTVVLHDAHQHQHVALCHYHPHKAIVVERGFPGPRLFVTADWRGAVVVRPPDPRVRIDVSYDHRCDGRCSHHDHHAYYCKDKHCKHKHHKHDKGKSKGKKHRK